MGRRTGAVVTALLTWCLGAAATAADTPGTSFVVRDSRIAEASGIAVGLRNPDVLYVQNDSGDSARFFAIDKSSGRTRAEIDVPGATNHDWEDIAVAPDVRGVPSVWLADIGDNREVRTSVQIYRVDEPKLSAGTNLTIKAGLAQRWDFRYPDGPHNAEGFTIDPVHRLMYVVTKSETNKTKVFSASLTPSGTEQTFEQAGSIVFPAESFFQGANLVTGAAYSPNLQLFVVRTYLAAFWWRVPDGDVTRALKAAPTGFATPFETQAEGIGFDGDHLWLNSEGVNQPVYRVPVPVAALSVGTGSQAPSPRPSPSEYLLPSGTSESRGTHRPLALAGLGVLLVIAGFVGRRIARSR